MSRKRRGSHQITIPRVLHPPTRSFKMKSFPLLTKEPKQICQNQIMLHTKIKVQTMTSILISTKLMDLLSSRQSATVEFCMQGLVGVHQEAHVEGEALTKGVGEGTSISTMMLESLRRPTHGSNMIRKEAMAKV